MTGEQRQQAFQDQLQALCPLVDNMRLMIAAARHAFNRHSQAQLEEMARLQKDFTLQIDPFFETVEAGLKKASADDKPYLQKLQRILTNLELMADKLTSLADHLRHKAKQGAILSDHDFYSVNNLFTHLSGFMEILVDIFQVDDAPTRAFVLQEGQKIRDVWFRSETDHETRMMDTPGQPNAWSIYLAILQVSREVLGHLEEIVKGLD
jgi:Na+/phosphate symporter